MQVTPTTITLAPGEQLIIKNAAGGFPTVTPLEYHYDETLRAPGVVVANNNDKSTAYFFLDSAVCENGVCQAAVAEQKAALDAQS